MADETRKGIQVRLEREDDNGKVIAQPFLPSLKKKDVGDDYRFLGEDWVITKIYDGRKNV